MYDEFEMTHRHSMILFLASRRNCRQLLAEGLAKAVAPPTVEIMSATIAPAEV